MKKQFKTKLILNSQTIRSLRVPTLRAVQGAKPMLQTDDDCNTTYCPSVNFGCRGCG